MTSLFDIGDRGATISADGLYRYDLWRRWDNGPLLGFIMLNPSTADADTDDKTIRRCIGFAKREGCAGIVVRNLYCYRTPKPAVLRQAERNGIDVVGPDADNWLRSLADDRFGVKWIVAAWGSGIRSTGRRIETVKAMLDSGRLWRLDPDDRDAINNWQAAPHPLYLPTGTPLTPYPESEPSRL